MSISGTCNSISVISTTFSEWPESAKVQNVRELELEVLNPRPESKVGEGELRVEWRVLIAKTSCEQSVGCHVIVPRGDPGWGLLMEPPGNE